MDTVTIERVSSLLRLCCHHGVPQPGWDPVDGPGGHPIWYVRRHSNSIGRELMSFRFLRAHVHVHDVDHVAEPEAETSEERHARRLLRALRAVNSSEYSHL